MKNRSMRTRHFSVFQVLLVYPHLAHEYLLRPTSQLPIAAPGEKLNLNVLEGFRARL